MASAVELTMPTILACTDGSAYASSVYDHAAWAARRGNAAVRVIHADDGTGRTTPSSLLATARHHLAMAKVDSISTAVLSGSFEDVAAAESPGRELVVLGKRGEQADLLRTELGRNVEAVVRRGAGPFLVAARYFRPVSRALLAFDGSGAAEAAAAFVAREPLFQGVGIHLLGANTGLPHLPVQLTEVRDRLIAAGRSVTSELSPSYPDIAIAATARRLNVDLLVMGAFGHSRIRNFFMGSTTKTMLRALPISVLLFRTA